MRGHRSRRPALQLRGAWRLWRAVSRSGTEPGDFERWVQAQGVTGQLDEVRVYADAMSADRIRAEYENQAAPDTFVSNGPPLPR